MKKNRREVGLAFAAAIVFAVAGCGYQQPQHTMPAVDLAAEEKAIRSAAAEWAKAIAAKDLEKTLSFYAADASVFPQGVPVVTGAEARRKFWEQFYTAPGLSITVETTGVAVAQHGDLAYETGKATETTTDKRGKTATKAVKYVVVWQKQADGQWKAMADIFNYDM